MVYKAIENQKERVRVALYSLFYKYIIYLIRENGKIHLATWRSNRYFTTSIIRGTAVRAKALFDDPSYV